MTVLEEIVAGKREAVKARRQQRPLAQLKEGIEPSERDFGDALRRPHTGFILECKQSSPSQGPLRSSYAPASIATAYAPFADAISVLTDEDHFGGSLEHLAEVCAAAPQPVLCKDFVVDPYQVYEARRHGADAILLMLSVLRHGELVACLRAAELLGMDALVEVHDDDELQRALDVDAMIIGINNRDLHTLEIDRATTARLAPKVPPGRVVVCESGIRSHADVREMRDLVDAFLVGTSLMHREDLHQAVRELIFGRVKICGLTCHADARAARASGATHGGMVLWEGSPRGVGPADAERMVVGVPLSWVGVFVDAPPKAVAETARRLALSAVQLHGDEKPEQAREVSERLPEGCEVWRAQRVGGPRGRRDSAAEEGADRLLLDAYVRGQRGGTGKRFDWDLARIHPERDRLVLSGGITPDRAAEADAIGCWALDVSSGVERAPGRKDGHRLDSLFGALRGRIE